MPEQPATFYDEAWRKQGTDKESRYHALWARVRFLAHSSYTVIDVGCGPGGLLATWPEATRPRGVFGIDFSSEALKIALPRLQAVYGEQYADVALNDVRHLCDAPEADKADAVIATEILEHLPRPDAVDVWAWMKRNGRRAIASVPYGEMKSRGHAQTFHDQEIINQLYSPDGCEVVDGRFLVFWAA